MRSYTVYIYGSGQPYMYTYTHEIETHTYTHIPARAEEVAAGAADTGAAAGAADVAMVGALPAARSTSEAVMRPAGPVPPTVLRSTCMCVCVCVCVCARVCVCKCKCVRLGCSIGACQNGGANACVCMCELFVHLFGSTGIFAQHFCDERPLLKSAVAKGPFKVAGSNNCLVGILLLYFPPHGARPLLSALQCTTSARNNMSQLLTNSFLFTHLPHFFQI